MIDRAIRRAVCCPLLTVLLLCLVSLFCAAAFVFAAVVQDHVQLKATHQAGVPPAPRTA
jgi:hypothetical protein